MLPSFPISGRHFKDDLSSLQQKKASLFKIANTGVDHVVVGMEPSRVVTNCIRLCVEFAANQSKK